MVSMLLLPCALPHARCRILGLHRHRTNLRSFPRKRESRGRELGQRTGSPLPRGRTELRGDSNSAHLALEAPLSIALLLGRFHRILHGLEGCELDVLQLGADLLDLAHVDVLDAI